MTPEARAGLDHLCDLYRHYPDIRRIADTLRIELGKNDESRDNRDERNAKLPADNHRFITRIERLEAMTKELQLQLLNSDRDSYEQLRTANERIAELEAELKRANMTTRDDGKITVAFLESLGMDNIYDHSDEDEMQTFEHPKIDGTFTIRQSSGEVFAEVECDMKSRSQLRALLGMLLNYEPN